MSGNLEADWGFTGHYYHAPSTLHLAWFRAYDAHLGRWISRDPIAEGGGLNVYAYANHDPVNYVDPDGRAPHTAVARGGYLLGAMLGDYLYDKYLDPYLDDYLAENVDPDVAENLKRLLDLADKARALKNPLKLGKELCASRNARRLRNTDEIFDQSDSLNNNKKKTDVARRKAQKSGEDNDEEAPIIEKETKSDRRGKNRAELLTGDLGEALEYLENEANDP